MKHPYACFLVHIWLFPESFCLKVYLEYTKMTGSLSLILIHMRFLFREIIPSEIVDVCVYSKGGRVSVWGPEMRDAGSHDRPKHCSHSAARTSGFGSTGRFRWLYICSICCSLVHYPFLLHSGIGLFVNSGKEIIPQIQTSASSMVVLSKLLSNLHNVVTVRVLYCGACSRTWERKFPFAGVAENSETVHCLGILLYG